MENKETNVNRKKVWEDGDVEKRIRQRPNEKGMRKINREREMLTE